MSTPTRPDSIDRARAKQAAELVWPTLTENEKLGVRYGLLPHDKVLEAIAKYGSAGGEAYADFPRLFSLAMFAEAAKHGGMIA